MKKIIKLSVIILVSISSFSCSNSVDGKSRDTIKLSQKKVTFDSANNSILITTEGEWWWISGISLNDILINLGGIDTTQNNFVIEEAEFRIERKSSTEIFIEMIANETGFDRVLEIALQAGNYMDSITITQLGS